MAELFPMRILLMYISVPCLALVTSKNIASTSPPPTTPNATHDATNTLACPANQTAVISNETTHQVAVCRGMCVVNACSNGGTCVFLAENKTACVCPPPPPSASDGGTVVYWGVRCEKETPQLALPLDAVIGVAAGGGGFVILLLVVIIIVLACKLRRANDTIEKNAGETHVEESSIKLQGSADWSGVVGLVNHGLTSNSMNRMSSYLHQPSFSTTNAKGEITFGYKDVTRQHHFDRRSLDLDDPNKVTNPRPRSNDFSNGVAWQPGAGDGYTNRRAHSVDEGDRRFVERNPDYHHHGPDMRQNGYTQGDHLYPQTHSMVQRPTQA